MPESRKGVTIALALLVGITILLAVVFYSQLEVMMVVEAAVYLVIAVASVAIYGVKDIKIRNAERHGQF